MILEVAILNVKPGLNTQFQSDFELAGQYISSIKGYVSHTLKQCLEDNHKYILLVNWETADDHRIGFRTSEAYLKWKALLHHYYDPFPTVEHYKTII
ncbi:antibiotic biosynthesis monooxygenase family protein [Formosa algae]|uniref:Heme-degrading monooxygenase HmoA n=1 Tax=Formosa algae TaxID=225843 RepID=A0A9X0YJY4_9FLAO|nr:antibiotic biosynthesis monooxygenase [Formosa algae]MBP1839994.1 heme-degrading monooxygenase HmoA [Formosa algae]MDQ0335593.1 heme-degrading monooxygenase HmoA [Formosa algae]OEI81712.1 antibiotic biosynthesis monooxygenase [Formosa algae]